jgi:hypothetical protein
VLSLPAHPPTLPLLLPLLLVPCVCAQALQLLGQAQQLPLLLGQALLLPLE